MSTWLVPDVSISIRNCSTYSTATLGVDPPALYAATVRPRREKRKLLLDAWYYPLHIGAALPSLPVWLDGAHPITLDLETTCEATCRDLRIQ